MDISGFGRNSDSDMLTFQNRDVERFEIQTGDIKTPPNRASIITTTMYLQFYQAILKRLKVFQRSWANWPPEIKQLMLHCR